MNARKLTRREFLQFSGVVAGASILTACGVTPTATPIPPAATAVPPAATKPPATAVPAATTAPAVPAATAAPTATAAPKFKEAPMLADLVKAGKLPPVEQRLPKNPKIVNEVPAEWMKAEIGKYGGTFRLVTNEGERDADTYMMCLEPIVNSPMTVFEPTPQLVEAFSVSADGKDWTFTLREGLKWSDGNPVTTDDVAFAINDVLFNKELTPTIPVWLCAGNLPTGAPFTFEVVDKWTWKVKFASAYRGFKWKVAFGGWVTYTDFIKPKHYLQKFHKTYTPLDKLQPLWEAEKLKDWVQLFTFKDITLRQINTKRSIGFPQLHAWLLVSADTQAYIYERNPYYHKIDAAGNQLPYIDKLVSAQVSDLEAIKLRIISGQIDLSRRYPTVTDISLYKQNEAKSGMRVVLLQNNISVADMMLNLTYDDPVWRQVVRDVRFRQALSFAINRKKVIDLYAGFGRPSSWIPSEYNPDKATKLLDAMGLDKKDAEGHRLGPDGKVFVIPFEVNAWATDVVPCTELFVQMWEAVGIKTTMKVIDQTLAAQKYAANQHQATCERTGLPQWQYGDPGLTYWCPLWLRWWNTGGKSGEEPPADVKDFFTLWYSLMQVPSDEAEKGVLKAKQIMNDKIYFFYHLDAQAPFIVNAKLGNVCEYPDAFNIAVNFQAEQMYYKS